MAKKKKAPVGPASGPPSPSRRLKSPDWRYTYCQNLLDGHRQPRPDDDKYVQALYEYLRVLRHEPADVVESYRDANPNIADAFFMFENGALYRVDVDTRVVARFTLDEIASVLGRPVEVIEYYVHCFFDVLEYLDNPGYLNRWVLEPIMRAAPFSNESVWKRIAIYGGKEMILALEKCTHNQLHKLFETLFDNLLLSKGIQAINGIVPNPKNAESIITLTQMNLNEKRKLQAFAQQTEDDTMMTQLVSAMIKSFAYGMATDTMTPADPLRSGQILDVSATPTFPNISKSDNP